MALILCLETSSKNCSVAISNDGVATFVKENFDEQYCHGEQLHVLIESLLKEAKISLNDFDAFAFSSGPGSYTGLRIGAASVKGFSFVLDKPIISVSTLKSMVNPLLFNIVANSKKNKLFCPVLDSRKGEVYLALYNSEKKEYLAPSACSIFDLSFSKYLRNGNIYFFGPGKYKLEPIVKNSNAIFLNEDYPSAKYLCALAEEQFKENDFVNSAYFEPMYLKNFVPTKPKSIFNK